MLKTAYFRAKICPTMPLKGLILGTNNDFVMPKRPRLIHSGHRRLSHRLLEKTAVSLVLQFLKDAIKMAHMHAQRPLIVRLDRADIAGFLKKVLGAWLAWQLAADVHVFFDNLIALDQLSDLLTPLLLLFLLLFQSLLPFLLSFLLAGHCLLIRDQSGFFRLLCSSTAAENQANTQQKSVETLHDVSLLLRNPQFVVQYIISYY